jgi:D-serine deaminase-like pyridoxal phosphate-dependent protein
VQSRRDVTTAALAVVGGRFDAATRALDPPLAVVDIDAFEANAARLVERAAGQPIRVASKSVRCRELLRDVLRRPGWRGVMAYSLPEANWLVSTGVSDDVLIGYPTAHRAAIAELAATERLASAVTIMIDSEEQLDLVDAVVAPDARPPLRVCLDLDASWRPLPGAHIGVRRSPGRARRAGGRPARVPAGGGDVVRSPHRRTG